MTIKVSLDTPTVHASAASVKTGRKKEEEHKDSQVKKKENRIDDPIVAGRVKRLAEHNRQFPFKCNLTFSLPTKASPKKKVTLSFNLSVGEFLKTCITNLRAVGFTASSHAKFKGGALSFLLDGHPKTLHDLDLSLKIEPPENPKDWQKIHEIIMRSLEEVACLTRPFQNEKDGIVVYKQQKINLDGIRETTFYEEMVKELDGKGHLRNYLFEQPGTVKTTWCTNEYFRSIKEQYILYAIPTSPCPIELEIVASHQNSSTCSLDALRIDYDLDDSDTEDFYYSAEDGWDPKYILELRDKGLFDVHKDRIPTIHLGFLRYNAMLLKGYLPTELAFEQLYGEHLADDKTVLANGKTALQDLEENLDKYLSEHCANFDKRVLYLLISLGTISRLHIAQSAKERLMSLYEKELKKALRVNELPKDFLENANLFFYLFYNDYKAHSKNIEKPLDGFYARDTLKLLTDEQRKLQPTRQLTRLYSKDGKKGDAFVLETTSLPSLRTIQEKLRMARTSDSAFFELCNLFIPDEERLRNLLGEKIEKEDVKEADEPKEQEKLEFADFAAFLTHVESSSLHPKKQAKCLIDLFSTKTKTLKDLDEAQREKLKNILIKALQPSVDKDRALAMALCSTASNEISFETLEELFDALLASSAPRMQVEFLNKIELKKENLAKILELWEKAIEKINSNTTSNSAIVTFFKQFVVFCEKAKNSNLLEEVAKGSSKIIETAINLFKMTPAKEVLIWCYQVQKIAALPFLQPLAKECAELIAKAIEQEDEGIVPLHLDCKHELFNGDEFTFFAYFSAFVKCAFPCKDEDSSCAAIQEGINHIVHKNLSVERAKVVLKILDGFSKDRDFPESLKRSLEFLSKYCQDKKVDLYTVDGLKKLKETFTQQGDDRTLDHWVDCFRIIRDKTKEDSDLRAINITALELFEQALKAKEISARRIGLLSTLNSFMNFKGWIGEEQARFRKCQLSLLEIRKASRKATAPSTLESPVKDAAVLDSHHAIRIAEVKLKLEKDPNDIEVLKELQGAYADAKDHENSIEIGRKLLTLMGKVDEGRWEVQYALACSIMVLGNEKAHEATEILEELLREHPQKNKEKVLHSLAMAYIYNQNWFKAQKILMALKTFIKEAFDRNSDYKKLLKIVKACKATKFDEAISLIDSPLFDAYARYCLIGSLYLKMRKYDKSISYHRKAAKECPNNPDPWGTLAFVYLCHLSDKRAALDCYEKSYNLDKKTGRDLSFIIANLHLDFSNWYPAIYYCAKALPKKENQKNPEFYKRFQNAILSFINSIGTFSSPSLEQVNQVKAILDDLVSSLKETSFEKDCSKYKALLEEAIVRNKTALEKGEFTEKRPYFFRLGFALYDAKLWQEGIEAFERGLELTKDKPLYYSYMAKGHFNRSDWWNGFSLMHSHCRISPLPKEVLTIFFEGFSKFLTDWQNKLVTHEAAANVKQFVQGFITSLRPGELAAMAKQDKGVFEKALRHFLSGSNPEQLQESTAESEKTDEKALVPFQQKDITEDETNLLKACEQNQDDPAGFMQLGKFYLEKGEKQKAIDAFEKVKNLDTKKKHPECYQFLGQLHCDLSSWYISIWHFAKFFLQQKGKMQPADLIRLRVAIVSFIHSIGTEKRPSRDQIDGVIKTVEILKEKVNDLGLSEVFSNYYFLLNSESCMPPKTDSPDDEAVEAQKVINSGKLPMFVALATACYKEKLWQLGVHVYEKMIEIAEAPLKTQYYAPMAKMLFYLNEWERAFSLFNKHLKSTPLSKNHLAFFSGGIAMFLVLWEDNRIKPEVAERVKLLVEDYISFMQPKDFSKMAYNLSQPETFLASLKKFISPKIYDSKNKLKRKG